MQKMWELFCERNAYEDTVNLRSVIGDQSAHIDHLERREVDFQIELQQRADLVLNLRSQMAILEKEYDAHLTEVELAREFVASGHEVLRAEVAELGAKLQGLCTHVSRVEREAQRTIRIVEDDLTYGLDEAGGSGAAKEKRDLVICVRRITAQDLPSSRREDLDPFVVLQLNDCKVETKVYLNGGSASREGRVVWDNLSLELPTSADELRDGSLKVQVWDFLTRSQPELVVGGLVSFPHHFSTVKKGTEFEWPVLFSDREGRPAGSVGLLLCVREKAGGGRGEGGLGQEEGSAMLVRDMLSHSVSQQALEDYVSSCESKVMEQANLQVIGLILYWI
jgi:hypothetical protein